MSQDLLYHAVRWYEYSIGQDRILITVDGGAVTQADTFTSRLLRLCDGARTIEAHVENVRQQLGGTHASVRAAFDLLILAKLVQPVTALTPTDRPAQRGPAGIETVGIITADRSSMLRRGLTEAMAHTTRSGRNLRFIIVDGSRDSDQRARTRAVAEELGRAAPVQYVGPDERRAIVSRLGTRGFDVALLSGSICTGAAGANRNLLQVLTAGRYVLTVDDDVRWTTWRLPMADDRVAFAGHVDQRHVAFFKSRADAVAAAARVEVDLIGAHETLLGRTSLSLLEDGADLAHACVHLLHALSARDTSRVRVTLAGLAGDSGTYCPYQLLLAGGPTRKALFDSPEALRLAIDTREIHRIAAQPLVVHDTSCMAFCMGLDNTSLLPPFMPIGRNQDGVFGSMLASTDPATLFAHLPVGIIHDSGRPSTREADVIPSATQTRLADGVISLLRHTAIPITAGSPSARLRHVGRFFSGLGELPAAEFRESFKRAVLDVRSRELVMLDAIASRDPSCPPHWQRAAGAFRDQFLTRAGEPDFFSPIEFRDCDSLETSFRVTQLFLRDFGKLLDIWPDVRDAASSLLEERLS